MNTTRPSLGKYVCAMAASLIIFLAGGWLILGSLRASGVLVAPTRVVAQAPAPYQTQAPIPQATAQSQSDLDKTLATLAAALAADLNSRRQSGSDQQNDQTESMVNRSEVR